MDSTILLKPSRILVIGGGISGSAFARMAAERGFQIDLYEQQSRFGGYAEQMGDGCLLQFHPPEETQYMLVRKFATAFSEWHKIQHTGMGGYYPTTGWHWFCASLLEHPEIRTLRNAYIQNAGACRERYLFVYNTASLDSLFNYCYGKLAYMVGFPIVQQEEETNRYLKYRRLADLCGFYNFGMQGAYRVITIEDAVLEAYAALNDLLQRKNKLDASVNQSRPIQGTFF